MKTEAEVTQALQTYADTVRRVCFLHLKSSSDVEDVFQEVFLKYLLHNRPFESDDHERSWLIRVSINACRDVLKSAFRKRVRSIEDADLQALAVRDGSREVLDAVLGLPPKYRNVIYLHYYEGYKAAEIGQILGKGENTIYTWLARARNLLKERLGGDTYAQ